MTGEKPAEMLCENCGEPVTGVAECNTEYFTDSYKLVDGKFVYDGRDVDDSGVELIHDECMEYPGDKIADLFHEQANTK